MPNMRRDVTPGHDASSVPRRADHSFMSSETGASLGRERIFLHPERSEGALLIVIPRGPTMSERFHQLANRIRGICSLCSSGAADSSALLARLTQCARSLHAPSE